MGDVLHKFYNFNIINIYNSKYIKNRLFRYDIFIIYLLVKIIILFQILIINK